MSFRQAHPGLGLGTAITVLNASMAAQSNMNAAAISTTPFPQQGRASSASAVLMKRDMTQVLQERSAQKASAALSSSGQPPSLYN